MVPTTPRRCVQGALAAAKGWAKPEATANGRVVRSGAAHGLEHLACLGSPVAGEVPKMQILRSTDVKLSI